MHVSSVSVINNHIYKLSKFYIRMSNNIFKRKFIDLIQFSKRIDVNT